MQPKEYIESLKKEEEMSDDLHYGPDFHIAKVQGRTFWFGSLHFKVTPATIEIMIRIRLQAHGIHECKIHWSKNKEHLQRPNGLVNQHPGCCMIELGDVETTKRAKNILQGMEFDGRPAVAACISKRKRGRQNNLAWPQATNGAGVPAQGKNAGEHIDPLVLATWRP
ncbi:hypothetical protein QBC34DRAFT_380002 [Podospora aff. communis PSN243]|uniref:Uncharacterized protein n=1 Tax=Podospora aff. communis PSN243 TaxID=3040156 RepID=A0AAV9GSB4_9PEZI|nr:hypothetical protein QBC34DRAFT_380002 [Podospora aff. communis PSN243]